MESSVPYRTFLESPQFASYRSEMARWLASGADEAALYQASAGLGRGIRAGSLQPEHLLVALHALGYESYESRGAGAAASHAHRYITAVGLFMRVCFGKDPLVRVVLARDDRLWTVMPIREGARWDPEIEMRRRDWLCCVTVGDRRYVAPLPRDWEQWTDSEIAGAIAQAKPDLRGP